MSPAPATSRSDSRAARQKGVLFCPSCWHESPVDGDWQVQTTETDTHLACPACSDTVAIRPSADADTESITLPVVTPGVAFATLTTRLLALGWRLCTRSGVRTKPGGSSCSLSTTDHSRCQP